MASTKSSSTEQYTEQDARFGFECLRNMKDGKVDLAGVGAALGYKNVQSVGNRFRQMRQKFGFPSLECTAGSSPARKKTAAKGKDVNGEDNGDDEAVTPTPSPVKRGAASASKKSRKGAKVSTEKPIPATAPVVKDEEGSSDEEKEIPKANFVVEIKNEAMAEVNKIA